MTTYNRRPIKQNYPIQTNSQLNKQKLKQLESQTYSNRTLARLISTAELYALSLGYKTPRLYKKFDQFNNLERKNPDQLLGELILQIQCCQVSMLSYINKFHNYDLPEDFDMNKTIAELENIRKQVTKKDKKYYKAIIQLIQGDTNIPSFDGELDELENEDEEEIDAVKDPELQLKMDIPIMKYVDSIKKQVKSKYEKNPTYKVKLELNKPFEKNQYFDNLVKIKNEVDNNKKRKKNDNTNFNNYNTNVREEHKYAEYY